MALSFQQIERSHCFWVVDYRFRKQGYKLTYDCFKIVTLIFKMKKNQLDSKSIKPIPERSNSSGNLLAKRLYRNNSLTKLAPLNASMSMLGSLNTSLIPSVSLRRLVKLDHSPPSIEISHGKIHLKHHEELPLLSQTGPLLKKKAAIRKFQKIDNITEKSILPEDLKADISMQVKEEVKKFKPSRKWLAKLKQGKEVLEEKLTPEDFIQLIEQQGGLGNEFCYLEKGDHPYDLKIVQFGGMSGEEYITISARGVTYFNWEGSRFVSLEEWRREAFLFTKLMKLEFFGKYKLHKNFTNWKKYSRKIGMKKTTDKLKAELLVHDRHLRQALLNTRDLCCRMEKQNYCSFDDSAPALTFSKFKAAQQSYLQEQFEKRLNEIQEEIKCEVANSLGVSMRDFKEENKISSGKEAKGLPLLIGDEKNLQMPYTKQATLRVQQQKFKRFLKLIQLLVVQSKVAMMNESTHTTARKLEEENNNYRQHLQTKNQKGKENHFKGKQYIQCQLHVEEFEQRALLKPTREQLTNLMEDIVNKSIIKLVRNHHRIINDPDINAILYEGAEEQNKEADTTNTLKSILGAEEKQEEMVTLLTRSISTSYTYLEDFVNTLAPLVGQYFKNQNQLTKIAELSSTDYFTIREWIERWRKELQEMSKLNEEHESAVFILNFKTVKDMAIQCSNMCLSKMKEVVPKILQTALKREESELKESLRLMEMNPIGIEVFIVFQHNKINITSRIEVFEDTLGEIGQLIEILKELGSSGEIAVMRGSKERKQLGQTLKTLRAKIEEAQMHSKVHENYAQEEVRKMIPKVYQWLQNLYAKTKQQRIEAKQMCQRISEWLQQFSRIDRQLQKLKYYQKFLGMEQINEEPVKKFASYFHVYESIWQFKLKVESYHEDLLKTEWKNTEVENIKLTLETYLQQSENLKKQIVKINHDEEYQIEYLDENVVNTVVGDIKKKIRPLLEAIQCLRDPSIEEREQRFIRGELEKKDKVELAQMFVDRQGLVTDLIHLGIIEQLDFLKKIVFKSKKQLELNSKMAAVSKFWGESVSHSSKSLIDNFSQHYWVIAEEIDQKITVINCVREDPEIEEGQFKNRVDNEKNMFDTLKTLLNEWEKHHNFLTYFQPIFANPYWKGTSEFKAYTYAQSSWKKLTKQISKDFSLRKLASQEKKHLSILRQNNGIFQDLKYSVEMFLNAKREAFPKLYFLSNEELLQFLLQDKDYSSIDKHLTRIFPNLKSLELNEQRNCPTAVRNMVNECLTLRPSPVKQVLELQQGLRVIQERMKEGIRSGLLKCSNYYMQDDFNRAQWIRENILQVLLFIGNAEFTKLLEYDYLQADGEDPSQLLTYQLSQLKELHVMIKDDIHNQVQIESNYKLSVLLMQAGHFRDIILKIIQENVTDDSSFEWQREVRSYYNGNDLAVTKYFTRSIDYGFEFVCANYSFTIGTLSQRQLIDIVNTSGLGYIPILSGSNQIVQALCNSNARSYFSVSLKPNLSSSFIQNICQGAFSSNTFLQFSGLEHFNEFTASTISSFIFETRSIIERRESFHLSTTSKNGLSLPSFNICFRVNQPSEMLPIQEHLKISFRVIKVPEISISTYLHFITELAFFSADLELGVRIEKCCEIINSCCGYRLIGLEEVRAFVISSLNMNSFLFREKITKCLLKEINSKFTLHEEIKFFEGIVSEVIMGVKIEQPSKNKVKLEWDSKVLINHIVETMKKKQACILVGPSHSGKMHLVLEAYKTSEVEPAIFHTDLMTQEKFLGTFENGLWKQGILSRHLKKLTYSQEEWLIFQGSFSRMMQELVHAVVDGHLLQLNGENLYLSPNWKFLLLPEVLLDDCRIPVGCEVIASEKFAQFDEELQYLLEIRISKYFKSNVEGFAILKNLCINNFEKVLKFRLKGRFLRPEHILKCFITVLENVLAKSPEKQVEQKQNQQAIEKLFLWSIFWTINTALNADQAKKFENQLFEQVKIEFDRSQPLNLCKFDFDNPQGSLRKVEQPIVQINECPYFVSEQMEAISKFIQVLLSRNKHVLLFGDETSGKSEFLGYIRQNLGAENYSFLKIRFSKEITFPKFEELLYRKAKIIVNSTKEKKLCAINGKQLILILDDINLVEEESKIGRFLKSILTVGYYYDSLSLQKIYLSNVSLLAAENSSYEFGLSYDFTKNFKPIFFPSVPIRDIIDLYHSYFPSEYSTQLRHNIASLHEFALMVEQGSEIYFKRTLDLPCLLLKTLRSYNGKQNIVKVWEYLSVKLYLQSNPLNESFKTKITAEVKNYSNLMLKNNQEEPNPIENQQNFVKELVKRFPILLNDNKFADYYVYLAMILQLTKPFHLFTLNEGLCPSQKEEILLYLCTQNEVEYMHPFRGHEIASKSHSQNKIMLYISDSDQYFDEIVDEMLSEFRENFIFILDFTTQVSWKNTMDKHPSILTFGCKYYKQPQSQYKLDLNPQYLKQFKYWLEFLEKSQEVSLHYQQEICRVIQRSNQRMSNKLDTLIHKKQKICSISRTIKDKSATAKKELDSLHVQLEELAKGEEKKRRELLQLKNNYQGELTEQLKAERNEKIQGIELELNEVMSHRRSNEDRSRAANEQLTKYDKITSTTKGMIQRVENQLKLLKVIKEDIHKIVVFLSILEYFYTKGEKRYDAAIEIAAKSLPFDFEDIMQHIYGCRIKINEKYGVIWQLCEKSIIVQDETEEFAKFLEKRYKNVHVIKEMKDLQDISQLEEEKAYIFIGQMRTEAAYLNDVASNASDKERMKKEEAKERQERFGKQQKDERPDYSKNIYFILKEREKEEKVTKEMSEIASTVSVKSRQMKEETYQPVRRIQRKATRLNTLRNTLSLNSTSLGLKKEESKFQQKETKDRSEPLNQLKQESTIKIKYKQAKQSQSFSKGQQQYQDYLIVNLQNEIYSSGGKRIALIQSRFHKNIPNVTFICRKFSSKQARETIHKFEPILTHDLDDLFEELLEAVDPNQTTIINNLEQELQKIMNKCQIQEKILLERLLDATSKSFNQIAKSGEFLQNIHENVKSVQEKVAEAHRIRAQPYSAYLKYCLILKDYEPILKSVFPFFKVSKARIRKIVLSSIKYNERTERDGELIDPQFKIDENQSICQFKQALMKEIIISLGYLESLYSLCLFAVLLEVKEMQTDKVYVGAFVELIQRHADKRALQKLLNQKQCSKELMKVFESFAKTSSDFVYNCHQYLMKKLEFNFEKEYSDIKSQWQHLSEPLIAIASPGADPFSLQLSQKSSFFIKENTDHSKCIEVMVERGLNKLVLVNFSKQQSYTKILGLFDELPKETSFNIILLFTSVQTYLKSAFLNKIEDQRIVVLEQIRAPHKQLGAILERSSKNTKTEHDKTLKFILFKEIVAYFKERIKYWNQGIISENACFYNSDFLLSLLAQAKIDGFKKMTQLLSETVFEGKEDLLKELRKWAKKQEEQALGKTFHANETNIFDENNFQFSHFMSQEVGQLKNQLTTAIACQDFARSVLASEDRKALKLDLFYSVLAPIKSTSYHLFTNSSIQEQWNFIQNLPFESYKALETNCYRKQNDIFKSVLRQVNVRQYLLYKWVQHQIKALKTINRNVILTNQTQTILKALLKKDLCFGLTLPIENFIELLQKRIIYVQQLYTSNQLLKKLNLQHWNKLPHIISLYLYSISKKNDLLNDQIIVKVVTEKEEKDRGWLLGQVELNNCKYDPLRNCLEINDKNELRKISRVALVLAEKQSFALQTLSLPLLFHGQERFRLQIGSKLKDEGNILKERIFGVLKFAE